MTHFVSSAGVMSWVAGGSVINVGGVPQANPAKRVSEAVPIHIKSSGV